MNRRGNPAREVSFDVFIYCQLTFHWDKTVVDSFDYQMSNNQLNPSHESLDTVNHLKDKYTYFDDQLLVKVTIGSIR